jgi:hypothetical protein
VRLRMPVICAPLSCGLAASISPITPATYGLAMLVPLISTHRSGPAPNPFAARIAVPAAAMSGFWRPSRVGPWLDVTLIRRPASSRLATATIRCPQASELIVERSTIERSEKNDGNSHVSRDPLRPIGRGSSRSIHAWYEPSRTSRPISRTSHSPARTPTGSASRSCGLR